MYTPDKPIGEAWRAIFVRDVVEHRDKYSKPINPNDVIKTHHQARKEFLENMGI